MHYGKCGSGLRVNIYIYIYIYVVGNGKQKWKVYRKTSMVIPELFLYM